MSYDSLYEVHSYTLLYIVKIWNKKFYIYFIDFFLCYSYIKHHDIPLFSMTKSIAAQKQYITKKIVGLCNIFSLML